MKKEKDEEKKSEKHPGQEELPYRPALQYITFEEEGSVPDERPREEDGSEWSVAWADLMMTMFVMFAMLFIYMKSEGDITEAFQPGDGSVSPNKEVSHQVSANRSSSLFPDKPTSPSSDRSVKRPPVPDPTRGGPHFSTSSAGLRPVEILQLAEEAVRETDLENTQVLLQDDDTVKISLRGPLLFDLGSANLREPTKLFLRKVALVISQVENEVHVIGHTDTFPIYTPLFPTNWELSTARAAAVARYLIRASDLEPGRFTIMGHSMYRPALPNTTLENKQLNRRVEILITKKIYTKDPLGEEHGSG